MDISNQEVVKATCECPNGNFQCHHMAALLLSLKEGVARTDVECQWKKPKKKAESSDRRSDHMWPSRTYGEFSFIS